ncbi:hypothetical protein AK812_SmicGene11716 [Symbiodinium microadriaticum]|uniref:Uncharacterized protein n=1 Tax=Symbiodinium microadriaticum TaxID=2951 RepID=A0A1Q9ECJ4_SYMMI|nr:hypothetical protein AK812_SmicGene11716 [Symbiodinium microadriaticum]
MESMALKVTSGKQAVTEFLGGSLCRDLNGGRPSKGSPEVQPDERIRTTTIEANVVPPRRDESAALTWSGGHGPTSKRLRKGWERSRRSPAELCGPEKIDLDNMASGHMTSCGRNDLHNGPVAQALECISRRQCKVLVERKISQKPWKVPEHVSRGGKVVIGQEDQALSVYHNGLGWDVRYEKTTPGGHRRLVIAAAVHQA